MKVSIETPKERENGLLILYELKIGSWVYLAHEKPEFSSDSLIRLVTSRGLIDVKGAFVGNLADPYRAYKYVPAGTKITFEVE